MQLDRAAMYILAKCCTGSCHSDLSDHQPSEGADVVAVMIRYAFGKFQRVCYIYWESFPPQRHFHQYTPTNTRRGHGDVEGVRMPFITETRPVVRCVAVTLTVRRYLVYLATSV